MYLTTITWQLKAGIPTYLLCKWELFALTGWPSEYYCTPHYYPLIACQGGVILLILILVFWVQPLSLIGGSKAVQPSKGTRFATTARPGSYLQSNLNSHIEFFKLPPHYEIPTFIDNLTRYLSPPPWSRLFGLCFIPYKKQKLLGTTSPVAFPFLYFY